MSTYEKNTENAQRTQYSTVRSIHPTGGLNDSKILVVDGGMVVKKSFLVERHRLSKFYQEVYGIHAARSVGIKTPKILGWNDLAEVPYILYEYIATQEDSRLNYPAEWEFIGRTLARTHRLQFSNKDLVLFGGASSIPAPRCVDYFTPGGGVEMQLSSVLSRDVGLELVCDLVNVALQEMPALQRYDPKDWYGFIHGDLHPGNILIAEDSERYVIDWEHSHFSDTRIDLLTTLHTARIEFGELAVSALLSGYTQSGGCSDLSEDLQSLAFIKWLTDRVSYWSYRRLLQLGRTSLGILPLRYNLLPIAEWNAWKETYVRCLSDFIEHERELDLQFDKVFQDIKEFFYTD